MTLTVRQTYTAVGPSGFVSFQGYGGIEPYLYTLAPNGAGGSINPTTGNYRAPEVAPTDPKFAYDKIIVTDYAGDVGESQVLVGTPLILFAEVIQRELGISQDRMRLWDQKLFSPKDAGLYVVITNPWNKVFGISNHPLPVGSELDQAQRVSMLSGVDIELISRDMSAFYRKEDAILAMTSTYAQQQQTAFGFFIAPLSKNFLNVSQIDGAAIPYRYRISVNIQYAYAKTKASPSFDQFSAADVNTDPITPVS